MFGYILLLVIAPEAVSPAVLSRLAYPPADPSTSYFSAVLYTRLPPVLSQPYHVLTIYCSASLVSKKWLLASMTCDIQLHWKVVVGVKKIPRYSIYRYNNFGLLRMIKSLDRWLILLEMDRSVDVNRIKPAVIGHLPTNTSNCFVASYMNLHYKNEVANKLHCTFNVKNTKNCFNFSLGKSNSELLNLVGVDYCLVQQNLSDPVSLCSTDAGAPLVCDNRLVGLVHFKPVGRNVPNLGVCMQHKTDPFYPVTAIYPVIDWVRYFTKERANVCSCNLHFTFCSLLIIVLTLLLCK